MPWLNGKRSKATEQVGGAPGWQVLAAPARGAPYLLPTIFYLLLLYQPTTPPPPTTCATYDLLPMISDYSIQRHYCLPSTTTTVLPGW